jgi:hypothetical protein
MLRSTPPQVSTLGLLQPLRQIRQLNLFDAALQTLGLGQPLQTAETVTPSGTFGTTVAQNRVYAVSRWEPGNRILMTAARSTKLSERLRR